MLKILFATLLVLVSTFANAQQKKQEQLIILQILLRA